MSLGWSTESALLPSKAKEIKNVSAGSMLGLKAQVAALSSGQRKPPHKRRRDPLGGPESSTKKKKPSTNPAVAAEDEVAAKASRDKLTAKAIVYDELAASGRRTSTLVNFAAGRPPPTRAADAEHGAGTQWVWGTGKEEEEPDVDEADVAAMLGDAARRAASNHNTGVRSQWEKTLTSTERGFLEKIATETAEGRRQSEIRSSERDRRRQALTSRLATLVAPNGSRRE